MGILLLNGPVNHSAIAWIKHGVYYGRTDRRIAGEVHEFSGGTDSPFRSILNEPFRYPLLDQPINKPIIQ